MRLATFNVLHGCAPSDGLVDLDRFTTAIGELDADVLALQEVDRAQPRSHGADLTAAAAEAAGAVASRFAPALQGVPGSWRRAGPTVDSAEPAYGVSLVSRYPMLDAFAVPLPALPFRVPMLFRGQRWPVMVDDEPRVAVAARLVVPGGVITVACTHLSFLPCWNSLQLHWLVRTLRGAGPLLLMGDLNMLPGTVARASGLHALASARTFPAHAPTGQLDHVLSSRRLLGRADVRVWDLPLSDHRALSIDLDLTALGG
ncbi:MAG: endonuclease/exonuclease/phosphatase family protein [Actinobacteria bacterium]|nr:endonuclease/exonuclease/phosphatase family protein [Actinomycetota bacterium]